MSSPLILKDKILATNGGKPWEQDHKTTVGTQKIESLPAGSCETNKGELVFVKSTNTEASPVKFYETGNEEPESIEIRDAGPLPTESSETHKRVLMCEESNKVDRSHLIESKQTNKEGPSDTKKARPLIPGDKNPATNGGKP